MPIAQSSTVTAVANATSNTITLVGTDSLGQLLTFAIATNPSHGTITSCNAVTGIAVYQPVQGYKGQDTFTFTVTNSSGHTSAPATVTINVVDVPVGTSQIVTVGLNSSMNSIVLSGTDPLMESLTFAAPSTTVHGGSLTQVAPGSSTLHYTPMLGFSGVDTFTFTTTNTDGHISAPANVSILVLTATPQIVTAVINSTSNSITLAGTDLEGQSLAFAIATNPSHGTITSCNAVTGVAVYQPHTGFLGVDTFAFTVANSSGVISAPLTVIIEVVDAAPTVSVSPVACVVNTSNNLISCNGTDIGGQSLIFGIHLQPAHGIASMNGSTGVISYTPNSGFIGYDTITVTATNTSGQVSAPAIITIQVIDVPVATSETVLVGMSSTANTMYLVGTDPAGEILTVALGSTQPAHGTASLIDASTGAVSYTPTPGFIGTDSFTFTVANASGQISSPATVIIDVTDLPIAIAPHIVNVAINSTTNTITLASTDPLGHELTYVLSGSLSTHGGILTQASSGSSTVNYQPAQGYIGTDTFTFTVHDSSARTSAPAIVTINVVENIPVVTSQNVNVVANSTINSITLAGTDQFGQTLTYAISGSLSVHGGVLTQASSGSSTVNYQPALGFAGTDTFTFTATNTSGQISAPATIAINVLDLPTATPPPVITVAANSIINTITLAGTDPLSEALTFSILSNPTYGVIASFDVATGVLNYTPSQGYMGTDSFTFVVTNESGQISAPATVTIHAMDSAPTVHAQNVTMWVYNGQVSITLVGVDQLGQDLTYNISGSPTSHGGTLTQATPGSSLVQYTSAQGYIGTDSFTFTATNTSGMESAPETVTIHIIELPPTAMSTAITANVNSTTNSIILQAYDSVNGPLTFQVPATTLYGGTLTQAIPGSASLNYAPAPGFIGNDFFTFTATNASGQVSIPTGSTISVLAVPPTAIAPSTEITVIANSVTNIISLSGTDQSGEDLTYTVPTRTAQGGTLTQATPGSAVVNYTPALGYTGTDSFAFTVTNTSGHTSALATVPIDVIYNQITAIPQTISYHETDSNYIYNFLLLGIDPSNESLTYNISGSPTSNGGVLTQVTPGSAQVKYTQAGGFLGVDTFTFTVTNTSGHTSAPATIAIQLLHDQPSVTGETITIVKGSTNNTITLVGTDPFNEILTFTISGSSTSNGGALTQATPGSAIVNYTPAQGFTGIDSFTFNATNTSGIKSGNVMVTIHVVDPVPTANSDIVTVVPNSTVNTIILGGVDPLGGPLTFTISDSPTAQGGVLMQSTPGSASVNYAPAPGFIGTDSFTFTATNTLGHVSASATITINCQNESLVTYSNTNVGNAISNVPINIVLPSIAGVAPFTYTITQPLHGIIVQNSPGSPQCSYTSSGAFLGLDTCTYTVTDSSQSQRSFSDTIFFNVAPQSTIGYFLGFKGSFVDYINGISGASQSVFSKLGVFNLEMGSVSGYISTDSLPLGSNSLGFGVLQITPDRTKLYAPSFCGYQVSVIDIATYAKLYEIAGTSGIEFIAISPDGSVAYCLGSNNNEVSIFSPKVAPVDTITGFVTDPHGYIRSPSSIVFSADGSKAYVMNNKPKSSSLGLALTIVDVATHTAVAQVAGVPSSAYNFGSFLISPDGNFGYLESYDLSTADVHAIYIIDTNPRSQTYNTCIGSIDTSMYVFQNFGSMAFFPDGKKAYVSVSVPSGTSTHPEVLIIDFDSSSATYNKAIGMVANVPLDLFGVFGISFASNGLKAYLMAIKHDFSLEICVVDVATHSVISTIPVNDCYYVPQLILNGFSGADAVPSVVTGQTASTTLGTPIGITLDGTDLAGQALTFAIPSHPTHGTAVVVNAATGSVVYTPTPGYVGTDIINYTVTNAIGTTSGSVTVSVGNVAPIVSPQTAIITVNTSNNIIALNGIDHAGQGLTFAIPAQPAHGRVSSFNASTGNLLYTPSFGYVGTDTINYTVTNSIGTTAGSLTITIVDLAPVVVAQVARVWVGSSSNSIVLNGHDLGGQSLTFALVSQPAHGIASLVDASTGSVIYTPTSGYAGTDTINYTVTNAIGTTSGSVTVSVVNGAPVVVSGQSMSVLLDWGTMIALNGHDVGGLPLTFALVSQPAHGTASLVDASTGSVMYRPTLGYAGTDTITYTVANSVGTTPGIVAINVIDNPPVILSGQSVSTALGTPISITLNGTDPAGKALTFAIQSQPAHGTVSLVDASTGSVIYTPTPGYAGTDTINYTVANAVWTTSGSVSITINDVVPVVSSTQAVSTILGTPISITLDGTDLGGQALTFAISSQPLHGTVSLVDASTGSVIYTPTSGYAGTDTINYTVTNSAGVVSASVTLSIADLVPIVTPQATMIPVNSSNNPITLHGTDPAGKALTFAIASQPLHGTASLVDASTGSVIYTPTPGYAGTDTINYTVTNAIGSTTGSVAITLTTLDVLPVVTAQTARFAVSTSNNAILLHGVDLQGQALTFALVSQPAYGTVSLVDALTGSAVYTPKPGFIGTDIINYTVTNSIGTTSGSVTVTVFDVAPVVASQTASTKLNVPISIALNGHDIAGQALTFALVSQPAHGTASLVDASTGSVIYTPTPGYVGIDTINYTVTNSVGTTSGNVAIAVGYVVPVVTPGQTALTSYGVPVSIALNGQDPAGQALTFAIPVQPANGTVSLLNASTGAAVYMPKPGFAGTDIINYTVTNSLGATSGSVIVSVADLAPIVTPQTTMIPVNSSNNVITLNGEDPAGQALTFVLLSQPTHGTASVANASTGSLVYTPASGFIGADEIYYTVANAVGITGGFLTITVVDVDPVVTHEDVIFHVNSYNNSITLSGIDLAGQALTFAITSQPAHGTVSVVDASTGSVVYTPNPGFVGSDIMYYSVTNAVGTTMWAVVITIVNVNPVALNHNVTVEVSSSNNSITLDGTDLGGQALTFAIASPQPAHGTISMVDASAGSVVYTPTTGFIGTDKIYYTVTNVVGTTLGSLIINIVDVPPVVLNQHVTVGVSSSNNSITLNGADLAGQALEFAISFQPGNGTVSMIDASTGSVLYTPNSGFLGADSIHYTVTNAIGTTSGILILEVATGPQVPVGIAQSVSVGVSSFNNQINLNGTNLSGQDLVFSIVVQPTHGTALLVDPSTGSVIYTPNQGFVGSDMIYYSVTNTFGTAGGFIMISIEDAVPIVIPQAAAVGVSSSNNPLTLNGRDLGAQALTFAILSQPAHGTVSVVDASMGSVLYTPNSGFVGVDIIHYTVTNDIGSATGAVVVTIANAPPVVTAQAATVNVCSSNNSIALNGSDVGGQALTFAIPSQPAHGTVSGLDPATGEILYTPVAHFIGSDTINYTVTNSIGSTSGAIAITVVDVAPTVKPISFNVLTNVSTAFNFSGSDLGNEVLTFNVSSPTAFGGIITQASSGSSSATYISTSVGTDTFSYTATNSSGQTSAPGIVTIHVKPMPIIASSVSNSTVAQTIQTMVGKYAGS